MSLYNPHVATMEADPTKAYNQDDPSSVAAHWNKMTISELEQRMKNWLASEYAGMIGKETDRASRRA